MEELIIIVPADEDILENGKQKLNEAKVKHQGVWRINLSDSDLWPSNPHGHNLEEPEKLNLLTGEIFNTSTKKYLCSLSKKAMNYIYLKIKGFKDQRIFNSLNSQSSQITYL